MANNKFKFTQFQLNKLNKVQEILYELKEYKPLAIRQIYYQLVGKDSKKFKTNRKWNLKDVGR